MTPKVPKLTLEDIPAVKFKVGPQEALLHILEVFEEFLDNAEFAVLPIQHRKVHFYNAIAYMNLVQAMFDFYEVPREDSNLLNKYGEQCDRIGRLTPMFDA